MSLWKEHSFTTLIKVGTVLTMYIDTIIMWPYINPLLLMSPLYIQVLMVYRRYHSDIKDTPHTPGWLSGNHFTPVLLVFQCGKCSSSTPPFLYHPLLVSVPPVAWSVDPPGSLCNSEYSYTIPLGSNPWGIEGAEFSMVWIFPRFLPPSCTSWSQVWTR